MNHMRINMQAINPIWLPPLWSLGGCDIGATLCPKNINTTCWFLIFEYHYALDQSLLITAL